MNAILRYVAVALVAVLYLVGVTADAGWDAPYTVDANTLHLWHFDEADPAGPALDIGNGTAVSLTPEFNAFLGSATAYAGFGTAADTTDNIDSGLSSSGSVDFSAISGVGGAFTIEALTRTSGVGGSQSIVCMEKLNNPTTERVFQFKFSSNKLNFTKVNGGVQTVQIVIPTSGDHAFVADEWFHVAVTYNGVAGEADNLKLYWTRVSESVTEANLIGQGTINDPSGSYKLTVGKIGRDGQNYNLEGQIDEVRISDIARDPTDMIGGVAQADNDPPDIVSPNGLNPTNGAIDVARNADLVASFDEEVALKDGGVITISNLTDTVEYAVLTLPTNVVTVVDGTNLTINLASPLGASTEYQVTIDANAVVDTSANSNAYTGLVAGNWTFTTAAEDNTAPTLIAAGLSPADNAEDIAFDAVLVAPFSEAIALADGGVITITDLTDGSGTMTLTLPTNVVTIADGTNLTIDLASDFEGDTEYQIMIDGSAVVDTSPNANAYTGLGAGVWTFTTRPGSMRWEAPYTADTNTLHLWHFDETDPGPALDTGNGSAVSLALQDSATLGATAYAGFGTAADTTTAGLSELNSSGNVAFSDMSGGDGAFTIEALIRTSEIGAVQQIVCMDDGTGRIFQFRISSSQLRFLKISGAEYVTPAIPTGIDDHAFVANEWFHVAVTYNGNEGVADNLKLYWTRVSDSVVEANLIGQGTLNSDMAGSSLLSLGNYGDAGTANNLKGQIDEVRISDIARDPVDMTGGEVLVRMGTIFKFR